MDGGWLWGGFADLAFLNSHFGEWWKVEETVVVLSVSLPIPLSLLLALFSTTSSCQDSWKLQDIWLRKGSVLIKYPDR